MKKKNIIKVIDLYQKYNNKIVLDGLNFEINKGEFLSILGPSGCGKSTLLRILVGIEKPTKGKIYKFSKDITNSSPHERNIGIVFQNYALFPNMTVFQNIAYALSPKHLDKEEVKKKVLNVIEMLGLNDHINKKPSALSGGQQQRVAIARSLITDPDIILLDEPMSALDANIKLTLRSELKKMQKKTGITMIYVTHDQEEAFALSDRIMIIEGGRLLQIGSPVSLYKHPKNEFVKKFIVEQLNEKVESILKSIK